MPKQLQQVRLTKKDSFGSAEYCSLLVSYHDVKSSACVYEYDLVVTTQYFKLVAAQPCLSVISRLFVTKSHSIHLGVLLRL